MKPSAKKLIEVSIPLKEINEACAREKSIRHGHPSTLHLWWARRPLAAARSVIFCQIVDDPSAYVEELMDSPLRQQVEREMEQNAEMGGDTSQSLEELLVETERERLHELVRQLVIWENSTDEALLKRAHAEIVKSWQRHCRREGLPEDSPLPAFHDPFAGGGALPLEAQRLGLESYATDLNPVAVTINKAMIEIPPKFAGLPPINPKAAEEHSTAQVWKGAAGLAEDVRHYGEWMREQAQQRIGHLYPPVEITEEMVEQRPDLKPYAGQELTVIAWLWARTVKSPNPAYQDVDVPLVSNFLISTKKGKEAYVEPVIENGNYRFEVRSGKHPDPDEGKKGTKEGRGGNFKCIMSGAPIPVTEIRKQGLEGTFGQKMMAIVCEGQRGRVYLTPRSCDESVALGCEPIWKPTTKINHNPRDIRTQLYGLNEYGDLFTDRQLVGLGTFSDLVAEARQQILADLEANPDHPIHDSSRTTAPLAQNGNATQAYAEAVSVYLTLVSSKCSDYWSSICSWHSSGEKMRNTFGRQAIPMVWDYAEVNPFCSSSGNWTAMQDWTTKALKTTPAKIPGGALQADAATQSVSESKFISTDPPYYDNIGYADLSDFFYVWMRKNLGELYPELYGTMAVPKAEELVATPYRHGGRKEAEEFFMNGMTHAVGNMANLSIADFPVTIYYAFKQAEIKEEGTSSTGWVTFLEAVIQSGFGITGTWPMRTELANRMIGSGTNALASSIVLVCRKREQNAPLATRREFVQALHREMPIALAELQQAAIAPVDVPQATIGPGMAIYTRYSRVVESDGSTLSIRTALQLINEAVDEFLSEQESEMDAWTRFAVTWFSQHAFKAGPFGEAQSIATARAITVDGVAGAGIIESGGGKVRIYKPAELPTDWDPATDDRLTVWEITHHLIRKLADSGEDSAAAVIKQVGSALAEDARKLAYRLYQICETNRWADHAQPYNELVTLFPRLKERSLEVEATPILKQDDLI